MARRGLRVIAGTAGGLTLVAPRGGRARPTTDRVKESLFAALGADRLEDVVVLDLYAGSGALGIEALSRGARRAVLVDRDRPAADACRRNLTSTRLRDRARVQCSSVTAFLAAGPPAEAPFGLVFLDPPYDTPDAEVERVLHALADPGWLTADASIVVERAAGTRVDVPVGLVPGWERGYGDTLVAVLTTAAGGRWPGHTTG
ncbi:MAG TPA: 16S rRNA (guanine(966)-N(2))-methyltransferase RsmD [Acidimicrobiia bacterium]|nr:16S rRNA (guanine(966)-N(2))-methyltransferase RsmD [Acidimicrobiia bacterium]